MKKMLWYWQGDGTGTSAEQWENGYKPKNPEIVEIAEKRSKNTIYHPKFNGWGAVQYPSLGNHLWNTTEGALKPLSYVEFKPFKAVLKKPNSPFNGMTVDVVSECIVKGEPGYMIKVDGSTHGPYFKHRFTPIDTKPYRGRKTIVRVEVVDGGYPC